MKHIALIIIMLMAGSAAAESPKIIETENGYVVEYSGTPEPPQKPGPDGLTVDQRKEISRQATEAIDRLNQKIDTIRQEEAAKKTAKPEDDVEVSYLRTNEIERSTNYVTYGVKLDVKNSGDKGDIYIKISCKNRDGFEIDHITLTGLFSRNESRSLSGTLMVKVEHAFNVRTWDIESVHKYKK